MSKARYWFAECTYDDRKPFYFSSAVFCSISETETEATAKLQAQVAKAWADISPHPAPKLLSVRPGRLVVDSWRECEDADKREKGMQA